LAAMCILESLMLISPNLILVNRSNRFFRFQSAVCIVDVITKTICLIIQNGKSWPEPDWKPGAITSKEERRTEE